MRTESAATAQAEPTSHFAEINSIRFHFLDWGGDPGKGTFLLLHGGAAHTHWWDLVAPMLTGHGRVLALDFRGHGRSQWADPPVYGPSAYVPDTIGLIEHLRTRVVLVGHSMGGAVSQWLAPMRPDLLEALIIIDAPAGPPPWWMRLKWRWQRRAHPPGVRPTLESAEAVVRKFRLSPPETYLSREALAGLAMQGAEQLPNGRWAFRFDPETRAWRRRGRALGRPKLRRISVPTLVLRGAESTLVSAKRALKIHHKIKGSTYREIPKAFHHVPLDNPEGTAAEIVAFLERLRSAGGISA